MNLHVSLGLRFSLLRINSQFQMAWPTWGNVLVDELFFYLSVPLSMWTDKSGCGVSVLMEQVKWWRQGAAVLSTSLVNGLHQGCSQGHPGLASMRPCTLRERNILVYCKAAVSNEMKRNMKCSLCCGPVAQSCLGGVSRGDPHIFWPQELFAILGYVVRVPNAFWSRRSIFEL